MKKILFLLLFLQGIFAFAQQTQYPHGQIGVTLPVTSKVTVVCHTYFCLGYSEVYKNPLWVMYTLTPQMAADLTTDQERESGFKPDPQINKLNQACDADYLKAGYDKGHLCPAKDMDINETAMFECFYYTNTSPQVPGFNRGIWKELETQVRHWALTDTLIVITGAIMNKQNPTIGSHQIAVPPTFYKIIVNKKFNDAIAFIMKNEKSDALVSKYIVTIDMVEQMTDIDFFSNLPKEIQDKLESTPARGFYVK
jgi:endonuclease G